MRIPPVRLSLFLLLLLTAAGPAVAIERFPPPDFVESDYQMPSNDYITQVHPRANIWEYIDVAVLVITLALAAWLIFHKRARKWILSLMLFDLFYFGFFRLGCVCPIGAVQNVSQGIFGSGYAVPLTVTAFFLLPLVVCLFFGRAFCGAVCPLGAIQDVVLVRPVKIPLWLESTLRLFAYGYLAVAVLLAATGGAFLICRYDPFVSFFRLSGPFNLVVIGVALLVIGLFIGRPYCRFLCPYGVILRHLSQLSRRKVTITPDDCINCRLCEDACPFNAIRKPTPEWPRRGYGLRKALLVLFLLLLPVIIVLLGFAGAALSPALAEIHPTVSLAEQIRAENADPAVETTDAARAFRASGTPVKELYAGAETIRGRTRTGGIIAGAFLGLVTGLTLIDLSIQKKRTGYTADPASCLACGRCYAACPREHLRLKNQNKAARK